MIFSERNRYAVTADVAALSIVQGVLNVLLVKRRSAPFKGCWALPGGFLMEHEDLASCARRELLEETGVLCGALRQVHTFGAVNRDPRERVITVAYMAILQSKGISLQAASDAVDARFWAVRQLPDLAFDHKDLLSVTLSYLTAQMEDPIVVLDFLPEVFSRSDLQRTCETILGRSQEEGVVKEMLAKLVTTGHLLEIGGPRTKDMNDSGTIYRVSTR